MALLGEMYYKPHGVGSWYNLPRGGGIAYVPQESWVLNETIRVGYLPQIMLCSLTKYPRTTPFSASLMTRTATKKVRRE